MSYRINPATRSVHIDFSMTTMAGFADMMTQLMTQLRGGGSVRQIVDMTGIQGNNDASLVISLAELMAMARSKGLDIPVAEPSCTGGPGNAPSASEPGGGLSVTDAVQSMGLRLESRKAWWINSIVDHIEKTPTEN